MQSLALPELLNGNPGLVASELHQVGGKPVLSQRLASLLNQQPVKGSKEDKAPATALLVTAFYSGGFGRVLGKACDGCAEGLLRGNCACDLALHDLGRDAQTGLPALDTCISVASVEHGWLADLYLTPPMNFGFEVQPRMSWML